MGSTPTMIGSGGSTSSYASLDNPTYDPNASNPYAQFSTSTYNPSAPNSTALANPTYNSSPGGGGSFGYMTLAGVGTQQQYNAGVQNAYALALNNMTAPELASYTQYLNQMTSADPTQRFAAVAPGAQGVAQQQQAARANIANLPRGGANSYLTGESYIQEASDIGNLINNAYTTAQQQKGQLGEFGVQGTEAGFGTANSALANSASTIGAAVGQKGLQQANTENTLASAAGVITSLLAGL